MDNNSSYKEIELEAYFTSLRKPWQSPQDNWKEAEMTIEVRKDLRKMGIYWGEQDI